jgi:transposase-like protein
VGRWLPSRTQRQPAARRPSRSFGDRGCGATGEEYWAIRLAVIPDDGGATLTGFVKANVALGSTVVTDGLPGYNGLGKLGYVHRMINQSAAKRAGLSEDAVPAVHRVISNMKTWLAGTHHGVGADHLDHYLDEFVFRFNRRYHPMAAFATLLGLGADLPPTPGAEILAPRPATATPRRRGRATAVTGTRSRNPLSPSMP